MRSLAALILALIIPALASATTVTVEALDGTWALGNVYTLGDDPPVEATTFCLLCGGTDLYRWTLIQRDECEGTGVITFVHALACTPTPIASMWIVVGNPSSKCWTLEECP